MTELRDEETPHWRGINHLALITDDMDATVRFYHGVFGLGWWRRSARPTSVTTSSNSVSRTRWRSSSTGASRWSASPSQRACPTRGAVQFDHLSFNLPDEHALLALRARLEGAGSEVTDVVDHGFIHSIYFTDPNGIALEASWWTLDATGRPADYGDERLFADSDPVPAVREIREQGRVSSAPHTRLA